MNYSKFYKKNKNLKKKNQLQKQSKIAKNESLKQQQPTIQNKIIKIYSPYQQQLNDKYHNQQNQGQFICKKTDQSTNISPEFSKIEHEKFKQQIQFLNQQNIENKESFNKINEKVDFVIQNHKQQNEEFVNQVSEKLNSIFNFVKSINSKPIITQGDYVDNVVKQIIQEVLSNQMTSQQNQINQLLKDYKSLENKNQEKINEFQDINQSWQNKNQEKINKLLEDYKSLENKNQEKINQLLEDYKSLEKRNQEDIDKLLEDYKSLENKNQEKINQLLEDYKSLEKRNQEEIDEFQDVNQSWQNENQEKINKLLENYESLENRNQEKIDQQQDKINKNYQFLLAQIESSFESQTKIQLCNNQLLQNNQEVEGLKNQTLFQLNKVFSTDNQPEIQQLQVGWLATLFRTLQNNQSQQQNTIEMLTNYIFQPSLFPYLQQINSSSQ